MSDFYETDLSDVPGLPGAGKVRVYVSPEARRNIEELTADSEEMMKRCIWRFLGQMYASGRVRKPSDSFTLSGEKVLELFADLRRIDADLEQTQAQPENSRS